MRQKVKDELADPRGPIVTPRSVVALLLVVAGIAWIAYYYLGVRADPTVVDAEPGGPAWMADLVRWNYVIGFGLLFLGLAVAAHPTTPLGRGRGVVVGMLGCFLIGLVWICVYYIFANDQLDSIPVFNDLRQSNLFVGIAFMGVGFVFATRWE